MRLTRRRLIAFGALVAAGTGVGGQAQISSMRWSLPVREIGKLPGDGFMISRCYTCENVEKYPGWWHTAEDWRLADDRESAGSEVLAVTDGEVVYAAYDYPGQVVIIDHDAGLYSVYGHLDYALDVAVGSRVVAGQVIGRLFHWTDGHAPSHLHFEMRDFYLNPIVNGDTPSYGVRCGYQCPPGPGYWPMIDGRHPTQLGWRNPTHVIGQGLAVTALAEVQVAATAAGMVVPVHYSQHPGSTEIERITLTAGDCFAVREVAAGDPATLETSALGYLLRCWVSLPSGQSGWIDAVMPDDRKVGSDGRPSSIRQILLPVPETP